MKSAISILLLFIGLSLKAQTVFPDNGTWDQKYHSIAWAHGGEVMWDFTFYRRHTIEGDSMAGAQRLLKLFENQKFKGYIRVDSLKVSFGTTSDTMYVLFDFGLKTGDSFTFHAPDYTGGTLQSQVSIVDSVFIAGEYRKRIFFNDFPNYGAGPVWIEGIGDIKFGGIELDYSYVSWLGNTNTFICFVQNGGNIYGSCDLRIQENEVIKQVWPNPTQGYITMQITSSGKPELVEVIDISGRKVFSGSFETDQVTIDLSYLKPGMYFISLYENGMKSFRKIIKE